MNAKAAAASHQYKNSFEWMMLRDHLAIAALQGLLAACEDPETTRFPNCNDIATHAYLMADAMLAAREPKDVDAGSPPAEGLFPTINNIPDHPVPLEAVPACEELVTDPVTYEKVKCGRPQMKRTDGTYCGCCDNCLPF